MKLTSAALSFNVPLPDPRASEAFLQQVVALMVTSHYKNTPNDLLLLADAPAHQLYVLLAPVDETQVRAVRGGGGFNPAPSLVSTASAPM